MPVKIDVIILSYAKDEGLMDITAQTIETLLQSEDPENIEFNVLVIESNRKLEPFQFANSTTIYPKEKFGFHRYFNIGIKLTKSHYVCLCNNDLIFHKNWASEILNAMQADKELLSAGPCIPGFSKPANFAGDDSELEGFFGLLFGWCIFVKREIFDVIGKLDENLTFWYSDNDYSNTLKKFGIKNCLVPNSKVTHLGSGSWDTMNKKEQVNLTQIPRLYFSYKWHHHSYLRYKLELLLCKIKLLFNHEDK